nr:MAG TPA: hypothetical protein [Caudoviricetes sp.]
MRYSKIVIDGYIAGLGTHECCSNMDGDITEAEYNSIMSVIQNRPQADGKGYRLKTDLTWEEYDLPPEPEPSDEDELSDAEALNILLGGANE